MRRIIDADTGPVGLACGNPGRPEVAKISQWMIDVIADGHTEIILPEIADYEVRRKWLTLPQGAASLRRLDDLITPGGPMIYAPITTRTMKRAAALWAEAWRGGYRTADDKALDGDVILAAQALERIGLNDRLFIATGNAAHLSRYVGDRAMVWETITP